MTFNDPDQQGAYAIGRRRSARAVSRRGAWLSPAIFGVGALVLTGVLVMLAVIYSRARRGAPDLETRVDPAPLSREARLSLPVPPAERDDAEVVTLETLAVTRVTPRLRETSAPGSAHRIFNLVGDLRIGRSSDNDIVLTEDAVSAHHCRLEKHGVSFRLIDLASTNQTWVNGEAKGHVVLHDGDEVKIGDTVFAFELFGDRK